MILHSNTAQAYNNLKNPEEALRNIQMAIEINDTLGLAEFKEKFALRKAKALSMYPDKLQEALDELEINSSD